jgi:hypothetical protein
MMPDGDAKVLTYEQRLDGDLRWARMEGSLHFENDSAVHKTLRRIARRLDERAIPYALAGDMAMFFHGFRRFTEGVEILVTPDGLKRINDELGGRAYVTLDAASKILRDTDSGMRIEFLVTGDYPGDGKPKPVAFPDPAAAGTPIDGMKVLQLPSLVQIKIGSGMTEPGRLKDLADVQELIAELILTNTFAERLDPHLRQKYGKLWTAVGNRIAP